MNLPFFHAFDFDWLDDILAGLLHYQVLLAPLFLLTIEESGIPLPLPGDVVIMYTGYQISKGTISYPVAFIILVCAVLLGSSILYYLSYRWGEIIVLRLGRFIHVDENKIRFVQKQFKKYGPLVIIFGRHIPGFRIPITIFSGISGVKYSTFIISTFISIIFWIAFYLYVGMHLGPKTAKLLHGHGRYFFLALIPFVLIVLFYVYMLYKNTKKKSTQTLEKSHILKDK